MNKKTKLLGILMAVVFGFAQPAAADLTAAGGVNEVTGFPFWFQDQAGVQLALCDIVGTEAEAPPCPGLELINPAGGFVAGNIEEAIYYGATAEIDGPDASRLLFIMLVEAAGGGIPGSETVTNGILWRLRGVPDGTYRIEHPFGVIDNLEPDGTGEVRGEIAILGAPPDFAGTLLGPVQWFLPNGTGFTDPTSGEVFFGDGVTEAPIQTVPGFVVPAGGFLGFRVLRNGQLFAETTNFTVEGKVFGFGTPGFVPLTVQRSDFSRFGRAAGTLVLFADSLPGATVSVSGVGTPLPGQPIPLTDPVGSGRFSAIVSFPATAVLPGQLQFSASAVGLTDNIRTSNLTDVVTVTLAQFTRANNRLQIRAVSSDQRLPAAGRPVLRAFDQNGALLGVLGRTGLLTIGTPTIPLEVTVRSSAGGAATVLTTIR